MDNSNHTQKIFNDFKTQYHQILTQFLQEEKISEIYLNKGFDLGRKAVIEHISVLSVSAMHHDALIDYLEKPHTTNHLAIAEKAGTFLEEVLAAFQMVIIGFRPAIDLLNKRSVEFAVRIKSLQEEIKVRETIEENLRQSEKKYRDLSEKLQVSLEEKKALLKETYHRVKNNLQVISSLLNLQLDTIQDAATRESLIASATRIKSMALIHEMLYQSDNLAKIDMAKYVHSLFKHLNAIYNLKLQDIKVHVSVDPISLNINKAIPCGLIINELVSNSFKHAFPNNTFGEIQIKLHQQDEDIILTVSDSGIGIPNEIDINKTKSVGMLLIANLTKQLGGTINIDRTQGTVFTLTIHP